MSRISIMLRTSEFRGDHAADIIVACAPKVQETIESLTSRLLMQGEQPRYADVIELRLIRQE